MRLVRVGSSINFSEVIKISAKLISELSKICCNLDCIELCYLIEG